MSVLLATFSLVMMALQRLLYKHCLEHMFSWPNGWAETCFEVLTATLAALTGLTCLACLSI